MADGVDPPMDGVQTAVLEAVPDAPAAEAELEELPASDDAVLTGGEPRDLRVDETKPTFGPYVGQKVGFVWHGAIVASHV
jgi:hypothetical protein